MRECGRRDLSEERQARKDVDMESKVAGLSGVSGLSGVPDLAGVQEVALGIIRESVVNTFLMMTGMEARLGEEYPHVPSGETRRCVSGLIGWVGEWTGTGIFDCSPEFACRLSNVMLGTETTVLDDDARDAVAEMTNMIFGGMKTGLEAQCGAMGLSIPTVIYGEDVGMRSSGGSFTVVPVEIEGFAVKVMVYLARAEETRTSPAHFWAVKATGAL